MVEIVDAREQQAEVAALENQRVAQDDVAAVLEAMALLPAPACSAR